MILQDITDEVKEANFYATLADEIISHNKEYLVLCVQFVAKNKAVRERIPWLSQAKSHKWTGDCRHNH